MWQGVQPVKKIWSTKLYIALAGGTSFDRGVIKGHFTEESLKVPHHLEFLDTQP